MIDLLSKKITEIDLPFVKEYMKVDYTEDDVLIQSLILAAQSFIQTKLGFKFKDEYPVTADIPEEFTIACLMIIAHWYDQRQIQTPGMLGDEIAFAVSAILGTHANASPYLEGDEDVLR